MRRALSLAPYTTLRVVPLPRRPATGEEPDLMFDPLTPAEWTAIALSLRVAIVAAVVSLPVGIALAYALARGRFVGHAALDAIAHLPLVIPPVATGYLLLITFGRRGPVGAFLDQAFGVTLAFNWTGAALASAVMALPLMVSAI